MQDINLSSLAKLFLTAVMLFTVATVSAQSILEKRITAKEGQPLLEFLHEFESSNRVRFYYEDGWLENYKLTTSLDGLTLQEALTQLLENSDVRFVRLFGYAVIFFKDPSKDLVRDSLISTAGKRNLNVQEVVLGNRKEFTPGKKITIKGKVVDEDTGEPLAGVSVFVHGIEKHFVTNAAGQYEVSVLPGDYAVTLQYINYQEKLVSLAAFANGDLFVKLTENPITLEEVVVSEQAITGMRIGQTSLKMLDLKRSPSFLGIADVIKQIQLQTGVTTVSEAASGFNVRGGGADQNLVLFDGVPIFNTAHALGFFTAFNAEAINHASFYKGGIPAEYGGRASSVLDIVAKEGDYTKWKGSGSIGVVASDLTIGGPVKKDTSSLLLSVRASYSDWILNLLKTRYADIRDGSVFFYDGSLKYSHKLDNKSKLTFSAYTSHDKFRLANDTIFRWQNLALALRYDGQLSESLTYNAGLYFGQYTYHVEENDPPTAFDLQYKITYPSLKIDFNRDRALHRQTFGFHTTLYSFRPGELTPTSSESNKRKTIMPTERSIETALYFSDAFTWRERLHIDVGIRLSVYNRFGPGVVYQYDASMPREPRYVTDSVRFGSGEFIKTYIGPEPRLSLRYTLDQQSSVKVGYNRMYQYVHLVSNTATVTPVDIWQSSNTYFRPQRADQVSAGYFRHSKNNMIEVSAEAYYKWMKDLLEFKDGASLILNPQLETGLMSGIGKAYGAEFSVDKLKGRLTGGINYTYSRSLRKVSGKFDTEQVNNGDWYPSNYDQPHIVNVSWRYGLTQRVFFTGIFTYHTGRPVSLPVAGYIINETPITDFSKRNNFRIPDYHRLDLALVIEGTPRKRKRWEGKWIFSLYNVYGRKNAYSLLMVEQGGGVLKPYKLSLIGTAVPSITYSFNF